MNDWQGALRLFRHEVGRSWGGLLATVIFFVYMGLIISIFIRELIGAGDDIEGMDWLADFLYLTLMPCLSFMMTRGMMKYWENDTYTRKLAYWRTLPISLNAIVLARMLQQAVLLLIVSLFFFAAQYAVSKELRNMLHIGEYISFVIMWMGYALVVGSSYIYFEQTLSGKKYLLVCGIYFALYIAAEVAMRFAGIGILLETLLAADRHSIMWPTVSAAAGVAALVGSSILLRKRLAVRSLLG